MKTINFFDLISIKEYSNYCKRVIMALLKEDKNRRFLLKLKLTSKRMEYEN
ncbi:hypothetical protein [Clostridium estertheticum]|uniref:hypothetical protein n=1 Tax=Clostridium estertheticum TaxID=238834 RepID=UPI00271495A7|nr:hypothetical protein [Clostridium estertheticum]WLC79577.1 hypothetical protein KTC98_20845 [Clostridium estertheticum]